MRNSLFFLCILILAHIQTCLAEYPIRRDRFVNDEAALMDTATSQAVRFRLRQLKSDHDIEVAVLTIQSLAQYGEAAGNWESFATRLFNEWGIGDASRHDGVLLLISKADRKIRIEVGSGHGRRLDATMKQIIDGTMTPRFRAQNFGQGIIEAVDEIAIAVAPRTQAVNSPAAPVPLLNAEAPMESLEPRSERRPPPAPSSNPTMAPADERVRTGLMIGFAVVVSLAGVVITALVGWGLASLFRRERKCGRCGHQMVELSEEEDDLHLETGQQVEEAMGSIDYGVWQCPACSSVEIRPRKRWFSGIELCPACRRHTLRCSTRVLVYADYDSTGSQLISHACGHCQFHNEDVVVIPRRVRAATSSRTGSSFSSHSSGGSSGGGRSSGGGASGGW